MPVFAYDRLIIGWRHSCVALAVAASLCMKNVKLAAVVCRAVSYGVSAILPLVNDERELRIEKHQRSPDTGAPIPLQTRPCAIGYLNARASTKKIGLNT